MHSRMKMPSKSLQTCFKRHTSSICKRVPATQSHTSYGNTFVTQRKKADWRRVCGMDETKRLQHRTWIHDERPNDSTQRPNSHCQWRRSQTSTHIRVCLHGSLGKSRCFSKRNPFCHTKWKNVADQHHPFHHGRLLVSSRASASSVEGEGAHEASQNHLGGTNNIICHFSH